MNNILKFLNNAISKQTVLFNFKNTKLKLNYCTNIVAHEKKLMIDKNTVNYVQVGNGEKTILCFPGALGTIWSDFKPQITQLDRNQFTIVAFDPPGYGQSRPPNRHFSSNFYHDDSTIAFKLMKNLGFDKFSLLGWSDGGISSIILAASYPDAIDKLVIWGANSYLLPEDIDSFERIRDTKNWSEKARAPLQELYGVDGLQDMWASWCDTQKEIQIKNKGNVCMECVSKVQCPTLILHGGKDPVVLPEHPNYLNANIRDSRLHVFPNGKHNIHLRYADEFNQIVSKFILE